MNNERIQHLLDRYISGMLTEEERSELLFLAERSESSVLESVMQALKEERSLNGRQETSEAYRKRKDAIFKRIVATDKTKHPRLPGFWPSELLRSYRRLLAAAAIVTALATSIYLWQTASFEPAPPIASSSLPPELPATYTRSFTLPDSSVVVLKAGSTLHLPTSFTTQAREVTLSGEAYFDIQPVAGSGSEAVGRPFIIHTGKVKTTVLGTTFHIKANPHEKDIVVSVTKGRVRVEDDSRVLAVLTQDQRVTYTLQDSESIAEQVDVQKELEWVRSDMIFDGVTFRDIAQVLEKRFAVAIAFNDVELQECKIVAEFSGTESLQNVLEMLCTVRNASYRIDAPDKYTLLGNGCD